MKTQITAYLNTFTTNLLPIRAEAEKQIDSNSKINPDGVIQLLKQPWIAPQSYGILLFPPAEREWMDTFSQNIGCAVPEAYQQLLRITNGCFIYEFSLFGLPKSIYTTGLLNRNAIQPYDLGIANTSWKNEYKVDRNLFHFSGRAYSDDENLGYFMDKDTIISARNNGEIINSWTSFEQFLVDELSVAEKMMLEAQNQ